MQSIKVQCKQWVVDTQPKRRKVIGAMQAGICVSYFKPVSEKAGNTADI